MNSCHEEVARNRNRARIEAADLCARSEASIPARFRRRIPSSLCWQLDPFPELKERNGFPEIVELQS
eukprot:gene10082-biopygen15438